MRNVVLASTLLVTLLTTACTPTQKKVGAGTLAAGAAGLAIAGVGSFVEGRTCENDPEDDCDVYGLMYAMGGLALAGSAVLAVGAGLLVSEEGRGEGRSRARAGGAGDAGRLPGCHRIAQRSSAKRRSASTDEATAMLFAIRNAWTCSATAIAGPSSVIGGAP